MVAKNVHDEEPDLHKLSIHSNSHTQGSLHKTADLRD